MWILPRPLHTSGFVPDMAALSLDSTECSEICARSLFVRSKPSPARTWSQKWKRDSWTALLSGRILRPSHGPSFVTAWTSSLVATPANPSAQPESGLEQKTHDIFGPSSQAEFAFCDPSSAISRMWKDTLAWDCAKSSETWEQQVTRRRGEYSARVKSARLTSGSGSSSWPSPIASEVRQGFQDRSRGMKGSQESLTTVVMKSWPTPDASNHRDGAVLRTDNNLEQGGFHGVSLHHAMTKYGQAAPASSNTHGSRQGLWRTPSVAEEKNQNTSTQIYLQNQVGATPKQWPTPASAGVTGGPTRLAGGAGNREKLAKMLPDAEARAMGCGKLNPRWVETLMGLPVGWVMPSCKSPVTIARTSCDSSATESCQPPQSELF